MKTLVLGIENPILGDDGVGFHVAQELAQRIKDDAIDIEDASTSGFLNFPTVLEIGKKLMPTEMPREIVIFAVEVEEIETFTEEMTSKVREAVLQVVELVLGEISEK